MLADSQLYVKCMLYGKHDAFGLLMGENGLTVFAHWKSLLAPDIDESSVMQLAEMGFPLEACRKAVYYTGNMGAEVAFNWIIAHMEEPGL